MQFLTRIVLARPSRRRVVSARLYLRRVAALTENAYENETNTSNCTSARVTADVTRRRVGASVPSALRVGASFPEDASRLLPEMLRY